MSYITIVYQRLEGIAGSFKERVIENTFGDFLRWVGIGLEGAEIWQLHKNGNAWQPDKLLARIRRNGKLKHRNIP
jgi:hypothetical protein